MTAKTADLAHPFRLLVRREIDRAVTSRWFFAYVAVFIVGGVLLTMLGLGDITVAGYRGFVRGVAGIAHIALLFVPVMALLPAITALADDQESGTLEYLLAQPVTFGTVYVGKWLGACGAMLLTVLMGMGVTAAFAAFRGVPFSIAATLLVFVIAIAFTFCGIGALLFMVGRSRARATTLGLIAWLGFLVFGTLGILTAFVRWGAPEGVLVAWTFANPIEAFRIGLMAVLDPDLSLLGPVGAGIVGRIGSTGTVLAAAAALTVWSVLPGLAGWWLARHRRAPVT